ncbi:Hypothetical predicted protein, partial [Olea europaea subsp. europaea]
EEQKQLLKHRNSSKDKDKDNPLVHQHFWGEEVEGYCPMNYKLAVEGKADDDEEVVPVVKIAVVSQNSMFAVASGGGLVAVAVEAVAAAAALN